jgi:hypothetical protein
MRPGILWWYRQSLRARLLAVVSVMVILHSSRSDAQSKDTVTLNDLTPPQSPAFVVLGIEPTVVQRPQSPRALTTALLSLAGDKDGVPKNLALEVAPFWLKSQPAFRFEDFYAGSGPRFNTVKRTIARSSAFSIGSTPRTLGRDTIGTSLGVGYRVLLWPGRASDTLIALKAKVERDLGVCAGIDDDEKADACRLKAVKALRENLEPVGWKVQLAGGLSAAFPHDTVQRGRFQRSGVWLSPSYRFPGEIEFIFVARYLRNHLEAADKENANLIDEGLRLLWTSRGGLGLSFESVARQGRGGNLGSTNSSRYGGLVQLRTSTDMYVFYAIGKDFAAANVPRNRLLSTIGLNLGFGNKPVITPK